MNRKDKKIVIEQAGAKDLNLREVFRYKDLLYFMVLRDITVLYKQTILGFAWAIINPLFQIIVFSIVFGRLVGVKPDIENMPYPIFSSLAVIPWTYFSNSLTASGTSLISTSAIFTKVYFPRIIIPLTPICSKMIDFFISFLILIGIIIYFGYLPGSNIVYLFIPLIMVVITAAGMGFWFSSLSMQYRDFKFALTFMLPLLMYIAPVAFPSVWVYDNFGKTAYYTYSMYPMVGVIEGFRSCFSDKAMPWDVIAISALSATLIFITGTLYFKRMEKYFADLA